MNLSGDDWLTPRTATGPVLLCQVLWDCSRTLSHPCHAPLLACVPLGIGPVLLLPSNLIYLLESTMQKRGEMQERISLPLVRKQSRVVPGFEELVANIFLPVLFPQTLPFKQKIPTTLLEMSQSLGESCLWIHTSVCLSLCCCPSESVIGMCYFQCKATLENACGACGSDRCWHTTHRSLVKAPQPAPQPLFLQIGRTN